MRKRSRPEFFEVFRQPEAPARPGWAAPSEGVSRRDRVGAGDVRMAAPRIILALIAMAVLIASHVWVYRLGQSRPRPSVGRPTPATAPPARRADVSEEDAFADADRSDGVAGSLLNVPFYTLRVISKIPLQSAKRLRRDLETMGFRPAFVYETGSPGTYTVCVGSFETRARAKESGFKEQLDHREYQGDKPFSDCFYFKITEQRRILK